MKLLKIDIFLRNGKQTDAYTQNNIKIHPLLEPSCHTLLLCIKPRRLVAIRIPPFSSEHLSPKRDARRCRQPCIILPSSSSPPPCHSRHEKTSCFADEFHKSMNATCRIAVITDTSNARLQSRKGIYIYISMRGKRRGEKNNEERSW